MRNFKNLRKEDILSFQENGVYFCFDRKGLREWVKRGNRTNPLTRQPLSADVLKKLGNLFPYDFVARIVYLNSFDGCEVSNLEVLNFQAQNYEKILLHFEKDLFQEPIFQVDKVQRTEVDLKLSSSNTYERDAKKRKFYVDGVTFKVRMNQVVTEPKRLDLENDQFGNWQPMEHPLSGLPCGVFGVWLFRIIPT